MHEQSFHCHHHRKIQVVLEQKPHQMHFLFPQNRTLMLYFQVLHLQVFLNSQNFLLKCLWLLLLKYLLNHLLVYVLEDQVFHEFCHQFLLRPYLLFLLFLLLVLVNQINYLLMEMPVVLETVDVVVVEKNFVDKVVV